MPDDFIVRAWLGGLAIAAIAGPLGVFVVWRRMAYFGEALSHSALLGIALGLVLAIHPILGMLVTGFLFALLFTLMQTRRQFAADTVLGLLAHSALAIGLLTLSLMERFRVDLLTYLVGDILSLVPADLVWIFGGAVLVLGSLVFLWRPLLAVTVDRDLAEAAGIHSLLIQFIFSLLLAVTVALAMRAVGILLIVSLLLIPAATARLVARSPEGMAVMAALIGMASVTLGLGGSLAADTPSGPTIVVAALILFGTVWALVGLAGKYNLWLTNSES